MTADRAGRGQGVTCNFKLNRNPGKERPTNAFSSTCTCVTGYVTSDRCLLSLLVIPNAYFGLTFAHTNSEAEINIDDLRGSVPLEEFAGDPLLAAADLCSSKMASGTPETAECGRLNLLGLPAELQTMIPDFAYGCRTAVSWKSGQRAA